MSKYLPILILASFISCATNLISSGKFDNIKFREKRFSEGRSYLQKYSLSAPGGGKLLKLKSDDIYKEYRLTFPDSSVIYIMNNVESGSRLNYKNRYESNILTIPRNNENDSLLLGGLQSNGRFWKEHFIKDIVVGYCNVTAANKTKFDHALFTLKRQN